jgi:hypothetical protein
MYGQSGDSMLLFNEPDKGRGPQALVALYGPLTDTRNELEAADVKIIAYPNPIANNRNNTASKIGGAFWHG